jgi:hypothetical protein
MVEMTIQELVEYNASQGIVGTNETFEMLLKAQSGVIPVAALEKSNLDKNEAALFLARELLFLRSVAEGAKLSMLAILFDELHLSLFDGAKAKNEGGVIGQISSPISASARPHC